MGRQTRQQQFSPALQQRLQMPGRHSQHPPHEQPSGKSHSSIGMAHESLLFVALAVVVSAMPSSIAAKILRAMVW
jgi:hypothetical protein